MSLDSIHELTIAAGARKLNDKIHSIGTPMSDYFDMMENQYIEPGSQIKMPILYKNEISQNITSGADAYDDTPIDPFEHATKDWTWKAVPLTFDGKQIQNNLGGVTLDEMARDGMLNVPMGSRNTLVNMVAPRLRNQKKTMREVLAEDFFYKSIDKDGRPGADGIDIITEPDTAYADLGYNELGPAPFKSDLMGVRNELWNPIHLDLGSSPITYDHITDAATDLQKAAMINVMGGMDMEPDIWNHFVMSTHRYNNSPMLARFDEDRRRTSAEDVEMGPVKPLVDSRLKAKFWGDPNLNEDGIVYFFRGKTILKCMQMRRSWKKLLKAVRMAYRQDRVLIVAELQYQYFCYMRHCTGWIKSSAS